MTRDTISALPDPHGFSADPLTDLIRSGARQLIEQAREAELGALLAQFSNETTDEGHARIVRHGHLPEREIMTGVGPSSTGLEPMAPHWTTRKGATRTGSRAAG